LHLRPIVLTVPAAIRRLVAVVIAATALVASLGAQTKTDPTLERLAADFSAAYNAADVARVVAFFADDAVTLPPNRPMTSGRAAIEATLRRNFEHDPARMTVTLIESAVMGDKAYEAGTREMRWASGTVLQEKYVRIWHRIGGDWKIAYWIWNRDTAAEPPK
jgi:ketosteroid isomerase-like protein